MGDVFDAMNRAKRERGEATPPPVTPPAPAKPVIGSGPSGTGNADAEAAGNPSQGLPLDEMTAMARQREPAHDHDSAAALPMAQMTPEATHAPSEKATLSPDRSDSAVAPDTKPRTSAGAALTPAAAERTGSALTDATARAQRDADAKATHLPAADAHHNGYAAQIIVHHDRGSVITEQYRAIRTQVLARARTRRVQTHVITSSGPEEGKSVTTINLGMTFAELRSQRTLLIEGDLRQPTFHKIMAKPATLGLIQLLRGEESQIDKVIQPTAYDNLQVIQAGGRDGSHSTELLSSPRMAQVLDRLRDRYDHIFIDSPPVVTVTDPCILGAMADQVLLVVRLHRTPQDVVDRAKRLLRAANCEIAGVILTHADQRGRYGYRYSYGYGYGKK